MGHLINPISLRVGQTSHWEDFWFQKSTYYSEFLHSTLKIKYFLIYYFNSEKFEKMSFSYSHFEIVKKWKSTVVRCFLYYGTLEELVSEFFSENLSFLTRKNRSGLTYSLSKYLKNQDELPIWFFDFLNVYFIFTLFGSIHLSNTESIFHFVYLIKKGDLTKLNNFLNSDLITEDLEAVEKRSFFIFLNLFYILYKKLYGAYLKKDLATAISKHFLISVLWYYYLMPFFFIITSFLEILFNFFFKIGDIKVKIYLISNLTLNSKFLSRFIARKLEQGYSVKEIITPLDRN